MPNEGEFSLNDLLTREIGGMQFPVPTIPHEYNPAPSLPPVMTQPAPIRQGLALLNTPYAPAPVTPPYVSPMYVYPVGTPGGPQASQQQTQPQRQTNEPPTLDNLGVTLPQLVDIQRRKESSGNYQAKNPKTTASGAYQYIDSTWNGYGGYAKAMFAPREVQDRRFQEDIQNRLKKYAGDPFKTIAEHYLPAAANNPAAWNQPYRLRNGKTVEPVANYVRYVVKGTPLEKAFNDYISRFQ